MHPHLCSAYLESICSLKFLTILRFISFVIFFRCRNTGCFSYYCGLHLYQKEDNSDLQRLEQLKSDIKYLQSQGVLVKLAYGGEEYGNTNFLTKVCNTRQLRSFA